MPTTDKDFEKAFSEIAFSSLKDKAPGLFDYLVGFQVLDVNEEQNHAIGVFGCHVGDEWVYLPVFFRNGELKGTELMYVKGQDMFVPLQENWINYFLHRKPYAMGETSDVTRRHMVSNPPDLTSYANSPSTWNKIATCHTWRHTNPQEWCNAFIEAALRSHEVVQGETGGYKLAADRCELPAFLKQNGSFVTDTLLAAMQRNHKLASMVLKYYPIESLRPGAFSLDAMIMDQKIASERRAPAVRLTPLTPVVTTKVANDKAEACEPHQPLRESDTAELPWAVQKQEKPKVEVLTFDTVNPSSRSDLSNEELERLIRGEIVIKDNTGKAKSKVYSGQLNWSVTNPTCSGVYKILTTRASRGMVDAIVVINPVTIGKGVARGTLCINMERKSVSLVSSTQILAATSLAGVGDWQRLIDSCESPESMVEGETYVILTPSGKGTIPFTVVQKKTNGDGSKEFKVAAPNRMCYGESRRNGGFEPLIRHSVEAPTYVSKDADQSRKDDCRSIILTDRTGTLTPVGSTLFVPSNAVVYKLKSDSLYDDNGLATMSDVQLMLLTNELIRPIKVTSTGSSEYQIAYSDKVASNLGYRDAMSLLLNEFNMGAEDAHAALKQAAPGRGVRLFVEKTAYDPSTSLDYAGDPNGPAWFRAGPSAPTFPEQYMQTDERLGVPTHGTQSGPLPVPSLQAPMGNRAYYNPDPRLDAKDNDPWTLAQAAGQSGQKEVFDAGMIASLLKVVDSDALVDRYMGDMFLGMDRIGRILFLYYQHNDAFRERYGDEDQVKLEDGLRNTLKSIGDLILFLKQKTVEDNPDLAKSQVDLTAMAS